MRKSGVRIPGKRGVHVAFLRGINVGRGNRVAMSDLRSVVASLGYDDVRTLLQSGNVVFSTISGRAADPAGAIEAALAKQLGTVARVTVIEATELVAALSENPLGPIATDPTRLLVTVLRDPADHDRIASLAARAWSDGSVVAIATRFVYTWCPAGVLASEANAAVAKALGDRGTARNWSTMLKVRDLACAE